MLLCMGEGSHGKTALNTWMTEWGLMVSTSTGKLRLPYFYSYCRDFWQNVRLQKVSQLICHPSALDSAGTLFFSAVARFHLRQFVFSLLVISTFLLWYHSYNALPPFSPLSPLHPLLLLRCYCTSMWVCMHDRGMFEVSRRRAAAQWDIEHRLLSFSTRCSFLSLSLHLRNVESLPLSSWGNNEVPAESGSSTLEQRLKTHWRVRRREEGEEAWETSSTWYFGGRQVILNTCWHVAAGQRGGGGGCVHVGILTHISLSLSLSLCVSPTSGIYNSLFLHQLEQT